ncbi:esterase/lipase family protein [Streptomyces longwoodensis]|uniref:esterase/lipase family protein n=1 Tax=Streptomyces longwoodensis TaxID=68231 RepID=UPI0033DD2944
MTTSGRIGVVFIHGFLSSEETWDKIRDRVREDPSLATVDPLMFSYRTPVVSINPLRRIPSYEDIADALDTYLETAAENYEAIALVGHSQGGLIIQRHLHRVIGRGGAEQLRRIRRVILFACPNNGSELARSWLRRNPQRRQLHVLNREVMDAQRTVINQVVHAVDVRPHCCPIPFKVYAGTEDNVVTLASAQGVFPDARALPGDHFTIIKPDSIQHRSHLALRKDLIDTFGLGQEPASPPPEMDRATSTSLRSAARTLDGLLPDNSKSAETTSGAAPALSAWRRYVLLAQEKLIHVEELVDQLTDAIDSPTSAAAVAVHGHGGLGKTAVTYAAVERTAAAGQFTHIVWASARNTRFIAADPNSAAINHIYWHDLLQMIARQLGCDLPPSQALWEREFTSFLQHNLHGARILIVIDNLEFVAAADRVVDRLRTLGVNAPHRIVATTRHHSERGDLEVRNIAVHPLSESHTYDLVRLASRSGNSDLQSATNRDLAPIYRITDGNPFLVKLIVSQYVVSGKSVSRIINDLAGLPEQAALAGQVREWLFERSLDELAQRSSQDMAVNLLFAFCANGRGGAMTYEELLSETTALDPEMDTGSFDRLLASACRLSLLRPSDMNRKYSIHSLLYEHTCPLSSLRRDG